MITLVDKKTKKIIAKEIVEAISIVDLSFGMLLSRNKNGLLLKTNFGIHTFFMKFPIDVIILNDKNQIVKMEKKLQPNRIFLWNLKYQTVLELPTWIKMNLQVGDIIELKKS